MTRSPRPLTRFPRRLAGAVLLALICAGQPATAAEGRYGQWNGGDAQLQKLVGELDTMVDEAERAKAAHPSFLTDLRRLADRYRASVERLLLREGFDDGDYTAAPAWEVRSGRFEVTSWGALSSVATSAAPAQPTAQEEPRQESKRERNLRLLLGLVGGLAGEGQGEATPPPTPAAPGEPGVILTRAAIDNAFTLTLDLTSRAAAGESAIGLFQGESTDSGYRLLYQSAPSAERPLQLLRYARGRAVVIADGGAASPNLDDGRNHTLVWSRDRYGDMVVSVDGNELLRVQDRSYRDPFSGVVIENRGGDFLYDNLELHGK